MKNSITINIAGDKFQITKKRLGYGSFSEVFKAQNLQTLQQVAVKSISVTSMRDAFNELQILRILNQQHENRKNIYKNQIQNQCLKLIGFNTTPTSIQIVTELYGQALSKTIKNMEPYDFQVALQIFSSVLGSMQPLRRCKILHRDIKPDNILLKRQLNKKKFETKICDFGFAIVQKQGKSTFFSNDLVGTLNYQAPEVLKFKQYSEKSDIWGLGIILYELIYQKLPFEASAYINSQTLYSVSMSKQVKFKNIPQEIAELGEKCLCINSCKRINFSQLIVEVVKLSMNLSNIVETFKDMKITSFGSLQNLTCSTTQRISERSSNFSLDESVDRTEKNDDNQIVDVDFLLKESLIWNIRKLLEVIQKNILENKKIQKEAELRLLNLVDKLLGQKEIDLSDYFSFQLRKALIMNIKKMKLICSYSNQHKKISFNLNEFVFLDTLVTLYDVIDQQKDMRDENSLRKSIEKVEQQVNWNGKSKSIKYYCGLREKVLNFNEI